MAFARFPGDRSHQENVPHALAAVQVRPFEPSVTECWDDFVRGHARVVRWFP